MAGIIGNSVSVTMTSGDTAADKNQAGYVAGEQVTLSVVHGSTPAAYQWGVALPSGATSTRVAISDATAASPTFTPQTNVDGYYVITCVVDNTTSYVLRLAVVRSTYTTLSGALRMLPKTAASVPAPPTGYTYFVDSDTGLRSRKDSSGNVVVVDPRTGTVTLASGAATITDYAATITATTVLSLTPVTRTDSGNLTATRNVGTSFAIASDNGADASVYLFSMEG